ncbi:MAG: SGNH/GDSL hydrolase family protein [Candidatus Polarisedimenticolia bacterium]
MRLLGWGLILAAPLLVLGCLEALARVASLGPAARPEVPAWLHPGILEKEKDWIRLLSERPGDLAAYYRTYRWDRDLFYRLQPDLELTLTDVAAPENVRPATAWRFHTNGRGYNTPEVPYGKPAGTLRIVVLGDSSTFGWGVDPEATYARRLETLLRSRHPGQAIEVINLGVCGYSSFQGRILLAREALRYQPDVVTLSYGSNDYSAVPEPFDVAHRRQQGWMGSLRGLLHHSRAYQAAAAWWGSRRAPARDLVLNVGPDRSRENLAAMAREVREAGASPLFVENCTPGDMAGPMLEAAAMADVPLMRTSSVLQGALEDHAGGRLRIPELDRTRALYGDVLMQDNPWLAVYLSDHCHPNEAGQRILAEALVPMVEATPAFRRAGGS